MAASPGPWIDLLARRRRGTHGYHEFGARHLGRRPARAYTRLVNPPRVRLPRHIAAVLAVAILAIAVALPVLAASPKPSGAPAASARGTEPKEPKKSEAPEVQVTIRGLVKSTPDDKGRPDFTLDANGKTLKLQTRPKWFKGTSDSLLPFVDKTVTIVGEQEGDEIDVISVDGTAIRAPGKPPWAGGWKVVGKDHPGWSQAKADRQAAKEKARAAAQAACVAAGQAPAECKGHVDGDADESPEPAESPGIG